MAGDGSCLNHAVTHQAGFISKSSRGDKNISRQLHQLTVSMMVKYPDVCAEDGLTSTQWLQKKIVVQDPTEWGGDLELCLLVVGLKRDIVVITASDNCSCCYARRFPCQPPPIPKMRGGIFIPLTSHE